MTETPPDDDILREVPEPLARALGERYLTYALSTIMHRALPDARDGLKPVHRRLLWTMRQLRLEPGAGYKKSARVVGDVMGKYHPHGDQSIYDALVRAAQEFSLRYPLIDGQGNFGNIDGDGAAAMRYTESRLTAVAAALMEGLDEDSVDLRPSYDGTEEEPEVLPAAFPNLLANGATGIAVGMATSIPPHNVGEVADALLALLSDPAADPIPFVHGPDFPTGGVLVEPTESIAEAYRTGRGGFRLRATWVTEDLGRGMWQIVVTEMPYLVQKGKLVERLADLITSKKVAALADVRDESAEDIRLVLEPRARTVDPAVLMETLFKQTDLEVRFPLNMNVLIDGRTPKVCGLAEVLRAYLDHRREVLLRRTRHRLGKIAHRLEIVAGYLIAFLNLDRVIEIIRYEDEPKAALLAERWPVAGADPAQSGLFATLTDTQAEAILNLRLRALRRLEELALQAEQASLTAEQADLTDLLARESRQWDQVADQVRAMRDQFGAPPALRGLRTAEEVVIARRSHTPYPIGARRTGLGEAGQVVDIPIEAMIEREPVTVVCSSGGWIRVLKGHAARDVEIKFRDGDGPRFFLHAQTTDRLVAFATDGRAFTLGVDRLPGGRGMGEPIRLMVDLGNDDDLVALLVHRPGGKLLVASDAGYGFVVAEADVLAQTKSGRQVLNLGPGEKAAVCRAVSGDHVAVVGQNRKVLVFPLDELPEMTRGKGVRLQRYKDGGLSDAITFTLAAGLTWPDPAGRMRVVTELADWLGKRAGAGAMAPRGFPRDNRF